MQYKREKEERFETLYEMHYVDLYRVVLYYTRDEHISKDIAQETFFQLYLHLDDVEDEKVRPYLLRIGRNRSLNWIRDNNHGTKHDFIENIAEDSKITYSVEAEYFHREREKEEAEFFAQMLEHLRKEHEAWYEILILVYYLGKDHEVVAEELGMTTQALYSKLYRAKQWLRNQYQEKYDKITRPQD